MAVEVQEEKDYRTKAEEELRKIRQNSQKWGVELEIKKLQEYVEKGGLKLSDIGTSEEELRACAQRGLINAALTWLRLARENCTSRDVSREVGYVRSLAEEAGITLTELGTSEQELRELLAAYKPRRGLLRFWRRKS